LKVGQDWWNQILKEIREKDCFVLVLTQKSLSSIACQRELSYAIDTKRLLIPISFIPLEDYQIPLALKNVEILDYSQRLENPRAAGMCAAKLGIAIHALADNGVPILPDPLPTPPEIPPSYLSDLEKYLHMTSLTLADQENFVVVARRLLNDDDQDRTELRNAIQAVRNRDLAERIGKELDDILTQLSVGSWTGDNVKKWDISTIRAPLVDTWRVADLLTRWYESEGMVASHFRTADHEDVVECHGRRRARYSGAGAALTTVLSRDGDLLKIATGGQHWGDKAASFAGAVAVTAATSGLGLPLVVPSAVGTYRQRQLAKRTTRYIEQVVSSCTKRG
jgi:hypothetical protein